MLYGFSLVLFSDPVHPVNVASIREKLLNWASQFPITGPKLNFMTGCHSCQSSVSNLLY